MRKDKKSWEKKEKKETKIKENRTKITCSMINPMTSSAQRHLPSNAALRLNKLKKHPLE
jgi:hypothetical protein